MKKIIKRWMILVGVLWIVLANLVYAADGATTCVQSYVSDQSLVICTDTPLGSNAISCDISSQYAEIESVGSFADENTTIQTTIILDISTSMPRSMQDDVLALLDTMVANKSANEFYCLCTISDGVHVLQDFTSERYDLAQALETIQFNGQESKIYDGIFNTLPDTMLSDETISMYRTIIITDGIDDTTSGITKEELYLTLQTHHYPIDVVAVTTSSSGENKDLAAVARMSNGRYFSLTPTTDSTTLSTQLSVNQFGFVVATVPASLLDGVSRQVDIADGVHDFSYDMKFPVVYVEVAEEPVVEEPVVEEPVEVVEPEPEPEPEPEVVPVEEPEETPEPSWLSTHWYILLIALLVVCAILLTILLVKRKKSPKEPPAVIPETAVEPPVAGVRPAVFDTDNTVIHSFFTIKISQVNADNRTWTMPVVGDLRIGRGDHCEICVEDQTVSREHCKIVLCGNHLSIVHLGNSNKTKRNGTTIKDVCPIASGDIIMMGRAALQIDYIQCLDGPPEHTVFKMDDEKTEYIF